MESIVGISAKNINVVLFKSNWTDTCIIPHKLCGAMFCFCSLALFLIFATSLEQVCIVLALCWIFFCETAERLCGLDNVTRASIDTGMSSKLVKKKKKNANFGRTVPLIIVKTQLESLSCSFSKSPAVMELRLNFSLCHSCLLTQLDINVNTANRHNLTSQTTIRHRHEHSERHSWVSHSGSCNVDYLKTSTAEPCRILMQRQIWCDRWLDHLWECDESLPAEKSVHVSNSW